jgi:8-oxo-dGTP pyrophosphatase MutT (NUDIX family)
MFEEKRIHCLNCGKKYHTVSLCTQAITSYGIINFKLSGEFEKYNSIFKNKYIIKDFNPDVNKINLYWFNNKNIDKSCDELVSKLKDCIFFLMISRKKSLGYIEFIRGRYDPENLSTVKHLMDQMTEIEITNILKTESFDTLWCELWKKTARNKNYEKEFETAESKFNILKVAHLDTISKFKPKYPIPEWGFPKGRRNISEKDIDCAIRECQEETSLDSSEISVLDRIYPISEQFKGTNSVEYKHTYYLSIVESNRNLNLLLTPEQYIEVETVGWFKYDRIINLIRPYHTEKKRLIDDILKFIAYNIMWIESSGK